jgi:methyltransferase (TIGR00027 family)
VAPIAIRHRYFDSFLGRITAQEGVRQVVLMAAGLDTRAFRLQWPEGTQVYELNQPEVLEHKEGVLRAAGARPTCGRQAIGVDLTASWQGALLQSRFDPGRRSVWLLEGFLFYLPSDVIREVLEAVMGLAALGSWLGFDIVNSPTLTSPLTRRWVEIQAAGGAPWIGTMDQPVEYLAERGWRARLTQAGAADAHYGRWPFPVITVDMANMPHNWFVTAVNQPEVRRTAAVERALAGESDLQAMMALARAAPDDHLHVVDLPYRLASWALDDAENVGLWLDDGQLLAWAVVQAPWWTVDYAIHPRAERELHGRILDWADRRARQLVGTPHGRPCWFANAFSSQTDRIRDLEAAGFVCQADVGPDSWSKVWMERPAHRPIAGTARPTGFCLRELAGESEVEAYVRLQRIVFETETMTAAWRARTLSMREYRADLDLVAVAPDGRLAAFCIGWLDQSAPGPATGQIEPLGVHPDKRGLGLGRAILCEGLRRLYQAGADRVCVETDKYCNAALDLYEAVGFTVIREVLVFRRDVGDVPD